MKNFANLSNEDLIDNLNQMVREAEQRVFEGSLRSFVVKADYAVGGIDWTASSAQCYGPVTVPDYGKPENQVSSWSESTD